MLVPDIMADSMMSRAYDLKGPVERAYTISKNQNGEIENVTFAAFDQNGQISRYDGNCIVINDTITPLGICNVKDITNPNEDCLKITFIRALDHKPITHLFEFAGIYVLADIDSVYHQYEFDEKGNLKRDSYASPEYYEIFGDCQLHHDLKPLEFDKWGNWTRRSCTIFNSLTYEKFEISQTRKIYYWPDATDNSSANEAKESAEYPIVFSSTKQLIDKPFGILDWNLSCNQAANILKQKSSYPFVFKYDNELITTQGQRPYYCSFNGAVGFCYYHFTGFESKEFEYNFYCNTLEEALDLARGITRDLQDMGVKMTNITGEYEYYRCFSGYMKTDGIGRTVLYNHKGYEVMVPTVDKSDPSYEVELKIHYSPKQ